MADSKISALPAVVTPAPTDESAVNQGGVTKKVTRAQAHALESGEHLVLPQVNEAATPTLGFGDGDSGFHEPIDDNIKVSLVGTDRFFWELDAYNAAVGTGPAMINVAAGAAVAGFVPRRSDGDTGIGSAGADQLSLIAGGIAGLELKELNSGVIQVPAADVTITAFATGGQGSAVALKQSYNVISVCATAGDSVKLPDIFGVKSIVYVKNNGAESCDVFPATGDDLGQGLNTAEALASGVSAAYIATTANATWTPLLAAAASGAADPSLLSDGTALLPAYSFTSDPDTGIYLAAVNELGFSTGGVEGIRITEAAGLITIPTFGPIHAPVGTAVLPSYSFAGRTNTGMYSDGANEISFATDGAERFRISNTQFFAFIGNGPALLFEAATETNPTLTPHSGDPGTGIGAEAAKPTNLSLIASSFEGIRIKNEAGIDSVVIHPGVIVNDPFTPSLAFGAGNSGFYESAANVLQVSIASVQRFNWSGDAFAATDAGGPAMLNENASGTNPTLVPDQSDLDTGIGAATIDQLNLIAGGLTCMSISETAGARQIGFYESSPISRQTGVAVTTAAIHAALVSLGLITA